MQALIRRWRNHKKQVRHLFRATFSFDCLESRQVLAGIYLDPMNGNLTIAGDTGNNMGRVTQLDSSTLRASVDGLSLDYSLSAVTRIVFLGFAGNDQFTNSTAIDGLLLGHADNDTLIGGSGIDQINGGDGNDEIRGNAGNDRLNGFGGADLMFGGAGNDFISTGDGLNVVYGEAGNDLVYGGNDLDTIYGGDDIDQIFGGLGDDQLNSGDGGVPGSPGVATADWVLGNGGNDSFTGGSGLNVFYGGDGDDTMVGGSGENRLHGQNGNDNLTGGPGVDLIAGHSGNDILNGLGGFDFIVPGVGDDLINGGTEPDYIFFAGQFADYQIFGAAGNLTVFDTRGLNGTDTVVAAEFFRFDDGERAAVSPVTHVVTVQPIVVSNSNGTNTAEFFGNSTEETEIMRLIDSIYYQAGIDVLWLTERAWSNTFANIGNGGLRPGADLDAVVTQGDAAGKGNSDPLVIDMYFVEIAAGFDNTSENTANGLAFVDANGITMHVGDNLVSFQGGRDVIARVAAHEIAHNLGLDHVVDPSNLMDDGDRLTAPQIADIRDSQFARLI